MASLTNLSVYGFQHSSQISQDEPLALYLHFELGSESQSSSVVKAGTGSTLEWSSDSLRFAEPSSTMQARLYQKHMLMPDSLLAEGQIPWEAVTSQSVCEVPLRGRQGGGTLRFSPRTGSAGSQYPNAAPASYQPQSQGPSQPPAYSDSTQGNPSGPHPTTSQMPHQGGGSQPPAYAGSSGNLNSYSSQTPSQPGQYQGSGQGQQQQAYQGQGQQGYQGQGQQQRPQQGQQYQQGQGQGQYGAQTNPGGVHQATTGEKARSWLHTNLDKLDKKIEKHNQPSSTYMQPQNSYQGPPQGGYQGPPQGGYQGPPQGGYQGNQSMPMSGAPAPQGTYNQPQKSRPGLSDWTKDMGSWTVGKFQQGVQLTRDHAVGDPNKPKAGGSTGSYSQTGTGYGTNTQPPK